MKEYVLTPNLYEKLLSRGMWLVCRICELPLTPTSKLDKESGKMVRVSIISKPIKYRQWTCASCRTKFGKNRPDNIHKCPVCKAEGVYRYTSTGKVNQEPIIKDVGRKFYCSDCYNRTVQDVED
jgi:hypothetical protein